MNKLTIDEHTLWRTFHRVSDKIEEHEEKILSKIHLTKAQYIIMLEMAFLTDYHKAPIIINDLAPFHNSSLVSISLIIDRMDKKYLVKKMRDLPDRRAVRIKLTPLGEKRLREVVRPTTKLIKEIFANFSSEEMKNAMSLMNKLNGNLYSKSEQDSKVNEFYTVDRLFTFLEKLNSNE